MSVPTTNSMIPRSKSWKQAGPHLLAWKDFEDAFSSRPLSVCVCVLPESWLNGFRGIETISDHMGP